MKTLYAVAVASLLMLASPSVVGSDPLLTGYWGTPDPPAEMYYAFHTCFVMAGRKAVMLAGRKLQQPQIYDPVKKTWTPGKPNPVAFYYLMLNVS